MASTCSAPCEFRPPLPASVLEVISRSRLSYLATVEYDDGHHVPSPHLSLMNFTVIVDESDPYFGSLIMSTRRDTKKFGCIQRNAQVAILVHDFGTLDDTASVDAGGASPKLSHYEHGSASITLYATAKVMEGAEAERLRALHLAKNKDYPHFVVGDEIAILLLTPSFARICDIHDRVSTWSARKAGATDSTTAASGSDAAAGSVAAASTASS